MSMFKSREDALAVWRTIERWLPEIAAKVKRERAFRDLFGL